MVITYEPEGRDGTDSDCTPALEENKIAPLTRTDTRDMTRTVPQNTTDEISFAFTTPTSEPNSANWPNSTYRAKYKITTADACDISSKSQLHRINSACTTQETLGTSGSHAGTGSFNDVFSVDPAAGATGDRYQMRLLGSNSNAHMGQDLGFTPDDAATQMVWDETPVVAGRRRFPQKPSNLRY